MDGTVPSNPMRYKLLAAAWTLGMIGLGLVSHGLYAVEAPVPHAPVPSGSDTLACLPPDLAADVPLVRDVRPTAYREVIPGETPMARVRELLGEPVEESQRDGLQILTYRSGPFSRVDLAIEQDRVTSILLQLKQPAAPETVASELQLDRFQPADVLDSKGQKLGLVYPERGILLSLEERDGSPQVLQLLLEPVAAEPFFHRAASVPPHHYARRLADLDFALQREPEHVPGLWQKARILAALGAVDAACELSERAMRLAETDGESRLLRAQLLYERGDASRAVQELRLLLSKTDVPSLSARVELLLGDFLAAGPSRNLTAALQHHLSAVKKASALVKDDPAATDRLVLETLLYAYLGAATDIAGGKFANKADAAPKWLDEAQALTEVLAEQDPGDPVPQLCYWQRALVIEAALDREAPLDQTVEQVFEECRVHIAEASDPLFQRVLEWRLAETLMDAVQIEHQRGNRDLMLTYANNALALAEPLVVREQSALRRVHLVGKLHFYVGASYSVSKQDHREAVRHFELALPYLEKPLPPSEIDLQGIHGERFVSMGVSFWQTGQGERALAVTKQGVALMDQAIRRGTLHRQALAVPYNNLAAMYRAQGNEEEARTLSNMAAKLEREGRASGQR